ncbi:RidA family protein [Mesorhizobium australafricanum]|uniref:RidA family protein n=1 Tax=Mesorhizobium australafricanum TaxID=3072311 RepID=A0ABU4X4T1_9HYPH|nr:RidA family protein [Mesorhizobium sp. VK3E]MDX8443322.1 RidA family protein [Mesorhizobium sp. VK3E]
MLETYNPEGWAKPRGYSQVVAGEGRHVFLSGQIGWNPRTEKLEAQSLAEEARQTLANVVEALAAAGAGPEHLAAMTWYVTDLDAYRAAARDIGKAYRELIGNHLPAITLVPVPGLLMEEARIEIEARAIIQKS